MATTSCESTLLIYHISHEADCDSVSACRGGSRSGASLCSGFSSFLCDPASQEPPTAQHLSCIRATLTPTHLRHDCMHRLLLGIYAQKQLGKHYGHASLLRKNIHTLSPTGPGADRGGYKALNFSDNPVKEWMFIHLQGPTEAAVYFQRGKMSIKSEKTLKKGHKNNECYVANFDKLFPWPRGRMSPMTDLWMEHSFERLNRQPAEHLLSALWSDGTETWPAEQTLWTRMSAFNYSVRTGGYEKALNSRNHKWAKIKRVPFRSTRWLLGNLLVSSLRLINHHVSHSWLLGFLSDTSLPSFISWGADFPCWSSVWLCYSTPHWWKSYGRMSGNTTAEVTLTLID